MKYFGFTETKLFHFQMVFKKGWVDGASNESSGPTLDLQLHSHFKYCFLRDKCYVRASRFAENNANRCVAQSFWSTV